MPELFSLQRLTSTLTSILSLRERRTHGASRRPTITSQLDEDRHLIAERDIDVTCGLHHLTVRRDKAQPVHGVGNGDMAHLVILIANHRTKVTFVRQLDGFDPEACAEDPIEGGRWAAALQMSEHAGSRFLSRSLRDFMRNHIPNSSQSKFAAFDIALNLLAIFWPRAFGDDNERAESSRRFPLFYRLSNFVVIKRDLRNQNDVRAARDAAVKRDPASVASHNFDNHYPFVARRRPVQPVEPLHNFGAGRIESEGHLRRLHLGLAAFR